MDKIVVPVDFSSASSWGFYYAYNIAKETGSELVVVHLYWPPYVESTYPVDMIQSIINKKEINKRLRNFIRLTLAVLILQIIYGAFVAGLDAGFIHNHWPMMSEGKFMHETVYIEQEPIYKNFIEGKSGVQFVHRILAYVVVFFVFLIWKNSKKLKLTVPQSNVIKALLIVVGIQFLLGVFTIIFQVPVWLGVAHQIGAFFLLSAMIYTLHRFSK